MPTGNTASVSKILLLTTLRKNCLQKIGDDMGIAFEYVPVLEYIRQHAGCMQVDISKKLKITPSAITQSTKKLESQGLIEKVTDSKNLRAKKMYITDKGIETLKLGTKIFDKIDEIMFEGFSDTETKELNGYLDRINAKLTEFSKSKVDEGHLPWEFK